MGTHGWEMPMIPHFQRFVSSLYLLPILYNPVQAGAKMTLLLLYRRLAPQQWYQISVYVVGFIVVGSSTAIMFATIFPCRPVRAAWDLAYAEPDCINRPAVYQATAVLGAVTDVLVLAIPIPIVVTLQIPRRQKLGLIAVFGIGFVSVQPPPSTTTACRSPRAFTNLPA
jgi:rhodopsin domain-containing protein